MNNNWIQIIGGKKFFPENPKPDDFDIDKMNDKYMAAGLSYYPS